MNSHPVVRAVGLAYLVTDFSSRNDDNDDDDDNITDVHLNVAEKHSQAVKAT